MASLHASTPPPPSTIHTPTTPRFGYHDDYQPFSPRKSTRVKQARSAQTPPPQSLTPQQLSPRSSRKRTSEESSSDMPSSPTSPQTATKKKTPRTAATLGGRRVSGALNNESTASAAAALGLPQPKPKQHRSMATVGGMGMLPTPDKTPKKAPTEVAPQIKSVARSLFTSRSESLEELMPSRKSKKKAAYILDSFEGHMQSQEETPISIFTDSHDRVPEADGSPSNPFYGQGAALEPEPVKRSNKRRKVNIPGEGEVTLEEAEQREDGLVYVFRGKKMFRKFKDLEGEDPNNMQDDEEDDLDRSVPTNLRGPRTRSSLKPRLLFAAPAHAHTTEDEEADTDIDESLTTPSRQSNSKTATPKAPRFAPASPPTTVRATRSKNVELSSSPAGPTDDSPQTPKARGGRGKTSPFDMWQRVKGDSSSRKREGSDSIAGGMEKKVRR